MAPSDVEDSQVERIDDLHAQEQVVAQSAIKKVSNELKNTSREKIKSEAENFLNVLDYLDAVRAVKATEKLSNELEDGSREEVKTDIENLASYNVPLDEIITSVRRKYRIGQDPSASSKEESDNSEPYYTIQDQSSSTSSKRESDSSDSDYAIQDQSSSTSSKGESDSSKSDYERQIGDEYPENWNKLRKQAYKRDDYHCRNCGVGGGPHGDVELHAHHVVPISAGGNHTLKNLYTLCETCHSLIHTHL